MECIIYTYVGGEFVAKVFDGIAMIFGGQNKEFNAVIQLSMVIGAFWISIKAIYGHNIGIFAKSWFVPSLDRVLYVRGGHVARLSGSKLE